MKTEQLYNNKFIKLIILIFITNLCHGQMSIDTSHTADYLVRKILTGKQSNLLISNVKYTGANQSIGYFNNNLKYNKFIKNGIILSTGNIFDAIGPNSEHNKSSKSFNNTDEDLNLIAKGKTFDAAVLEIEFIPKTDSISFNFFFASEEYPEYVNKNVNDIFGFFLIDNDLGMKKNLALLPNSNIPISIDNINSTKNSKYYIQNGTWEEGNISKWVNNKQLGELAYTFQFDGFSTLFHVGSKVIPNHKYLLKLAIADVGDRLFDSGIFLEANSFNSTGKIAINAKPLLKDLIAEKFSDNIITNSDSVSSIKYCIEFEFNSYKISGTKSYVFLDKVFNILNNDSTIKIEVQGHTDSIGSTDYNKKLSENRAKTVSEYLIAKGIAKNRIKYFGFGATILLSETDMSLNRRVEFIFKRK